MHFVYLHRAFLLSTWRLQQITSQPTSTFSCRQCEAECIYARKFQSQTTRHQLHR